MVKVLIDPRFDKFEFSEVHNEAVGIELTTGKSQADRPIVSMYVGAISIVTMLAVGERNVVIGFLAGKHDG